MSARARLLLAALASAAAVAASPPAASALGGCVPASEWPTASPDLAAQVVDLVNAHREQLGLQPLAVSPTLTAAATWKARHMAAYGYLAHDDPAPPTARSAGDRLAACGYPAPTWGENIATGYTTASDVFASWLASPEHRANIERPDFVATGVAVAGSPTYWSQTFGSVADAGNVPPAPSAAAPTPAPPIRAMQATAIGGRSLRARCGARRHGATWCRIHGARGATVRVAMTRHGIVYARRSAWAGSDDLRLRLRTVHALHAGRYAVLIRTSAGRQRRLSVVVP